MAKSATQPAVLTGGGAEAGTRERAKGWRVVFIDQARALAITMMLVGHSLDRFLGETWRVSQIYRDYQFVRGITSALFLMVSGFSFVVASFKYWEDYIRWSPRMWGRVRRIALIYLLGYALHMWSPTLVGTITTWNPDRWARLLQFDILQNIATGLLLLHLVVIVVRKKAHFWKVTLAGYFAVILLGTITFRPEVDAMLPVEIGVIVNMYHKSAFPLIPWMGFLLIGATIGYWFWERKQKGDEWKVFVIGLGIAIGFIVFEHAIRHWIEGGIFPYSVHRKHMPGNIFARGGFALMFICLLYLLGRWRLVLPRLSFILSKDSLAIYFVHLFMVYGCAWFGGFFYSMRHAMTPLMAFTWIASLFIAMAVMGWAIGWMRDNKGNYLRMIRHILLAGFIGAFLFWPHLTGPKLLAALAASTWAVVGMEWYRLRRREERELLSQPAP
jgi:uncharacterized membrane protein